MGPKLKPTNTEAKTTDEAKTSNDEKRPSRRLSKKGKKKEEPPPPPEEFMEQVFAVRSFLFIKLEVADHLPKRKHDLEIHLSHPKNTMQKISHCHYSKELFIELKDYETKEKPTFCMIIEQDNVEEMNLFSDNPLEIKLYEHVRPKPKQPRLRLSLLEGSEGEEENNEGNEGVSVEDDNFWIGREVKNILESDAEKSKVKVSIYDKEVQTSVEDFVESFVEEELEEERLILLAIGHIDLLPFFCKKRTTLELSAFLYPLFSDDQGIPLSTTQTTWRIYTTVPLLKQITFCNMAFVSFESIFNAKPDITDDPEDLEASLYFESNIPNEQKEFPKKFICTYSIFYNSIIDNQNTNIKWQTLKNVNNLFNLGIHSNCKLSLHKMFKNLLWSDGTTFDFSLIDTSVENALICNSVHRYMVTVNDSSILEEAIAFNQYHILIEIYRQNLPEEILLTGILDLAVFCYPNVNAMRFAIELKPSANKKQPGKPATSGKDKKSTGGKRKADQPPPPPENPTFCIINICLLSPISDIIVDMTKLNENTFTMDNLKRCDPIVMKPALASIEKVIQDNYKLFDELILEITSYLVKNQIQTKEAVKSYLCCQLSNLINRVMKLIACDFNIRIPTNTNVEFNNLLTTVFKELEQRIYERVQNFDAMDPRRLSDIDTQLKIVTVSNIMKLTEEAGDHDISYFIFGKITTELNTATALNFYIFIYRIESETFELAKEYLTKPVNEKYYGGEFCCNMAEIYLDYIDDKNNEETYNQSIGKLIENIKRFTEKYPRDIEGWILLYCVYKKNGYLSGMHFARWKYENLYTKERRTIPPLPVSRWNLYLNYDVEMKTKKGKYFWEVFRFFTCIGLYKFCEFVFDDIASECTEVERYLITTTIKVLTNNVPPKAQTKTFAVDKMPNGNILKAFLAQVNGCFEFVKDNQEAGCKQYGRIMEIKLEMINDYQLSLLRYGHKKYADGAYQAAYNAFKMLDEQCSNFFVQYDLGRTLFRLHRFEEAERSFANSTNFCFHTPNMWAWLALINLKMGNNYNVLACWRYAKLNPEVVICDEVLKELSKIPHESIDLYVDNVTYRR